MQRKFRFFFNIRVNLLLNFIVIKQKKQEKFIFKERVIFGSMIKSFNDNYLITKINVTTYISLIIFSALYFLTLIFLKRKNA